MLPKLVRDGIPKRIVQDGKIPLCTFVDNINVEPYIFNKIREEVAELHYECTGPELNRDKIVEEFADVFEILFKLMELYDIEEGEIRKAMLKKAVTHGCFNDNIILKDIILKGEETK